jgi:hypothetical protein
VLAGSGGQVPIDYNWPSIGTYYNNPHYTRHPYERLTISAGYSTPRQLPRFASLLSYWATAKPPAASASQFGALPAPLCRQTALGAAALPTEDAHHSQS